MYSDMSIRTIAASESKSVSASAFASSVLPTPGGPRKRKLPTGRRGSLIPLRARRIASVTSVTASSWPMTRLWSVASRRRSFSFSPSTSRVTGTPVHLATISAISSPETSSLKSVVVFPGFSSFFSSASSWGILPWRSSATLFRS
jgi:hypothetical protein